MRKDIFFGKSAVESMAQTTVSGGEFGNGVDSLRTFAQGHMVLSGAVGTDIVLKLQESSDDVTYTDVPVSRMIGGVNSFTIVSGSGDNTVTEIAGFDLKRYSRLAVVSGAGDISAVALLCDNFGS